MSLRAAVTYVFTRGVAGVMGMVALALFVRGLGPERYAQYTLGIAAAALASNLFVIPLNSTLARLYGEPQGRGPLLSTLAGIVLGGGALVLALALMLELLGRSWLALAVLPCAALFAAAQGYLDFSAQVANSQLDPARYARLLLIRALGVSGFGMLAIVLTHGAPGVLLGMALANIVALLFAGKGRVTPRGFDTASLPRIVRFAMPLALTCGLSYVLQWGDRYVLAHGVPLAELGRYSALADFNQQALTLLFAGLSSAWYPRVVQAWGAQDRAEAERLMSRFALMGFALLLPAGLGVASELGGIARLLFGEQYAGVPLMLPACLAAATCVSAVKSFYFDVRLLLAGRVWWQALGIALSACIALATMWLLLPQLGVLAAACGLLAGQSAGLLYSAFAGRGVLRLRVDVRGLAAVCVAALVMWLVLRGLPRAGLVLEVLRIVLAGLSYVTVLLLCDVDGMRARVLAALRRRLA